MSEIRDTKLEHQIIAMDNALAKQSKSMDVEYQRMFYIALAHIRQDQEENYVVIDKKDMFDLLNMHDKDRHSRMRRMWQKLIHMTDYSFGNDMEYASGFLIYRVEAKRSCYHVFFEKTYMPLLTHLSKNFMLMLRDDAIVFKSKFSSILYQQFMRLHAFGSRGVEFSTRELKQRFGMKDDDYVVNGNFQRKVFERKSVDVAVKEINELSKCINDLRYEKVKNNRGQVLFYKFYFTWKDPRDQKILPEKAQSDQMNIYDYAEVASEFSEDIRNYDPFRF